MKFHFHDYTHWSDPVKTYEGKYQQWTVCVLCNKAHSRIVSGDSGASVSDVREAIYKIRGQI